MDYTELAVRLSGLCALVLTLMGTATKSKSKTIAYLAAGCLVLVVHMLLLNQITGAAIALIGAIRLGLAGGLRRFNQVRLAWGFTVLYLGILTLTYSSPLSALPTAATLISTWFVAVSDGAKLKLGLAGSNLIWLVFDYSAGAYEMAIGSALATGTALWAARQISLHTKTKEQINPSKVIV